MWMEKVFLNSASDELRRALASTARRFCTCLVYPISQTGL